MSRMAEWTRGESAVETPHRSRALNCSHAVGFPTLQKTADVVGRSHHGATRKGMSTVMARKEISEVIRDCVSLRVATGSIVRGHSIGTLSRYYNIGQTP